MNESYIYVNKESRKFISKIIHSDWNKNQEKNKNISHLCYSNSLHEILETEEGKELEEEWKRRILLENTPRGNVVMYYDIYKRAFVYASDQNIPYPILNVCAMKYVIVFRCFDFFIDSTVLPKDIISPFIQNLEDLEKKEKEVTDEKKKKLGISFKNAPFIKAKPYTAIALDKKKENTYFSFLWNFIFSWIYKNKIMKKIENSQKKIDKNSNNFRYIGKISNIPFLLNEKKKITKVSTNHSVPIEAFDYLAYKKNLRKKEDSIIES